MKNLNLNDNWHRFITPAIHPGSILRANLVMHICDVHHVKISAGWSLGMSQRMFFSELLVSQRLIDHSFGKIQLLYPSVFSQSWVYGKDIHIMNRNVLNVKGLFLICLSTSPPPSLFTSPFPSLFPLICFSLISPYPLPLSTSLLSSIPSFPLPIFFLTLLLLPLLSFPLPPPPCLCLSRSR